MLTERLATEIAELVRLGRGTPLSLRQIVDVAVRVIPGAAGSTATLWKDDRAELTAATHPDVGRLVEFQARTGEGPTQEAITTMRPVLVPDFLTERRWPRYAAEALRRGVRAQATSYGTVGDMALTFSVYGVRAGAVDASILPVAQLLVTQTTVIMDNASIYGAANRSVRQMRQAVESRPIIDQAKGILMHALGCDEEAAFAELRRRSQQSHVKLAEVARDLVRAYQSQ